MKDRSICILIAEPDLAFRRKLKNIFNSIEATSPGIKFTMTEPDSVEEIEKAYRVKLPDIIFMDSLYLLERSGRIMKMFKGKRTKDQLIMLISDDGAAKIKELISSLEKKRPLYLNGHILKENFSRELITVLVRFFIKKIAS